MDIISYSLADNLQAFGKVSPIRKDIVEAPIQVAGQVVQSHAIDAYHSHGDVA